MRPQRALTESSRTLSVRSLLIVALLAVATRALFEVQVHADRGGVGVLAAHLLGDECAYDELARSFADGSFHRERAFYQEPLYAFALGLLYRVASPPPSGTDGVPLAGVHVAVIVVQHLLGVVCCLMVATLGARAVSRRAGLIAGVLAALSGPLIFAESQLLKEGPALALWLLSLHLWLDLLEGGSRRRAIALGVCLGLGVLLRGNTYILLAFVLLTLLARVGGQRRVGAAAFVLGAALLALSPATLHNLSRGEFVLSTYQSGSNAAIGMPDDDQPGQGVMYQPLRSGRSEARNEEADAVALAEQSAGRRLSGPEISRHWWGRVSDVAARRPAVALERVLRKLAYTVHPDEIPDVKDWNFFKRAAPVLSTWFSDLSLCGPLAVLGLLLLPWRGRPGLLVVRLSLAAVALTLMLFFVFGRYRLAASPAIWILAAGAIDEGLRRVAAARAGAPRVATAAGLLIAAAALVGAGQLPLRPDPGNLRTSWVNVALVETSAARAARDEAPAVRHRDAAVDAARAAIAAAPSDPDARWALVLALDLSTDVLPDRRAEGDAEAVRLLLVVEAQRTGSADALAGLEVPLGQQLALERELRRRPSLPGRDEFVSASLVEALCRVAEFLRDGADLPLALECLQEAQRRAPGDTAVLAQQGLVLKRMGRLPEAEAAYRAALAAGADTLEVNNNLANVLLLLDRPAEAVTLLEHALALEPGNEMVRDSLERARGKASAH